MEQVQVAASDFHNLHLIITSPLSASGRYSITVSLWFFVAHRSSRRAMFTFYSKAVKNEDCWAAATMKNQLTSSRLLLLSSQLDKTIKETRTREKCLIKCQPFVYLTCSTWMSNCMPVVVKVEMKLTATARHVRKHYSTSANMNNKSRVT